MSSIQLLNIFSINLENTELKQKISNLQKKCNQLNSQNQEFLSQIESMTKENKRLQEENETLLTVNEAFGQENDQLRADLNRFQSIRLPRSMRIDLTDEDNDDSEDRATKRHKTGSKGKSPVVQELDSEEARVCN